MSTVILFEVYGTNMMLLGYVAGAAAYRGVDLCGLVTRVSVCQSILELSQNEVVCMIGAIDHLMTQEGGENALFAHTGADRHDVAALRNRLVGALP